MKIEERSGVISGFSKSSSIVSQCQECAPVEDCDCHCKDDDELIDFRKYRVKFDKFGPIFYNKNKK